MNKTAIARLAIASSAFTISFARMASAQRGGAGGAGGAGGVAAIGPTPAGMLDETIPPGINYDKADFRFWNPPGVSSLRGVLVLMPGSNGEGRQQAQDTVWQAFAARQKLAIVACHFTDKPHDQNFIEDYVNVSRGSGQALLDAIGAFAERSRHPELATAPLVLWGMSAGGQFDYEFAAWKPERVAAFVVNKGGIYYTALTSRATREVPALLFIGGKDLESRISTITGLFAVNRRGGALWALTDEPGAAHIVGRSREMSIVFFDDVLPMRIGGGGALQPIDEKAGFVGDPRLKTIERADEGPLPTYSTAWLPTERAAHAWLSMITEAPFEP
jgi:poly(3-hydroxybutyrate) depolymerase